MELKKVEALIKKPKFNLSTPQKVAEALLVIRTTKQLILEAERIVKEKTTEMLEDSNENEIKYEITDPETGEVRSWEIRKLEATELKDYDPKTIVNVLKEKAYPFLRVSSGKLESYLKKESYEERMDMDTVAKCKENIKVRTRKGYVILRENK